MLFQMFAKRSNIRRLNPFIAINALLFVPFASFKHLKTIFDYAQWQRLAT